MSRQPVKLFMGMIVSKNAPLNEVRKILSKKFYQIDFESDVIDFDYTDYYYEEMGRPLKRKFMSFKKLIKPDKLAHIKNITCEVEKFFSQDGKRTINIDPGYIEPAKVILSSTKNFFHRIYLNHGVYAEVTLHWRHGEFKFFDWTFPDYRTAVYKDILTSIRNIYMQQIK